MHGVIVNLLNKVLGSWVENLNSEQLNLSLFSGVVELENLNLKSDILQVMGLPLTLAQGFIGRIKINIPWSAWYSSPLDIEVEDICVLLKPIHPEKWNPDTQKQLILKHKKYLLDQFEITHPSDLEINSETGFFKTVLAKIVDNVHVRLKNIYLRYEDSFNFYEPFAIGLTLKEVALYTCNELWEFEYLHNTNVFFKLILIENFSVFADYEEGIVLYKQWFEGNSHQAFKDLVTDELFNKVYHKYILFPLSARIEVKVDKIPKSLQSPEISAKIMITNLNLQLYINHLNVLVKFHKFMNLHYVFSKGIENMMFSQDFSEENFQKYHAKYKRLRNNTVKKKLTAEKLEKLKKKIEDMESEICASKIMNQRREVIMNINLKKLQKSKEKEVQNFQRENKRRFSTKIINLIGIKSESQIQKEEVLRQQRLSNAQYELKRVIQRSNSIIKQAVTNLVKDQEPDEKVKYFLNFSIEKISFSLSEENSEYLNFTVHLISFKIHSRPRSQNLKISLGKCLLLNKLANSQIFPIFFESEFLHIYYDNLNNIILKTESGDLKVFLDFDSILSISSTVSKCLKQDSEFVKLIDNFSETTERYLIQGQQYIKEVMETGVPIKYEIELDIKAPLIVIPANVHDPLSPVIFLDFGQLIAKTSSTFIGTNDYNVYRFELKNFRISTENLEAVHPDILLPIFTNLQVFVCKVKQFEEPGFCIRMVFSKCDLWISDKILVFLAEITKKATCLMNNLSAGEEPKSKIPEIESETERITQNVPATYQIETEGIKITLIEKSAHLAEFGIFHLKLKANVSSVLNFKSSFSIGKISVKDLSHTAKWVNIVSSLDSQSEEIFEDAKQEVSQIKILFSNSPKENKKDVSIKIFGLRVNMVSSFYLKLKAFYEFCLKIQSESNRSKRVSSTIILSNYSAMFEINFNSRYSLYFEDLEMCFPSIVESSWEYAKVQLNLILIYVNQFKANAKLGPDKKEYIVGYANNKNEANMMLNHLTLEMVKEKFVKNIMKPSRISIDYVYNDEKREIPETNIQIRMESLCMAIGFRDLDFFYKLRSSWFSILYTKSNKNDGVPKCLVNKLIEFDSLQVTLQEDTTKSPYSIGFFQFSNFFVSTSWESGISKMCVAAVFFMNYFNIPYGAWEPLIEDWKFSLSTSQTQPDMPYVIELDSKDPLNLNITKAMMETLGIMMQRFYQTYQDWGEMTSVVIPTQKKLDYEIINNLGTDIEIWFLNFLTDAKKIKNGESQKIMYEEVKKIYAKVKPKNKFEVGKNLIPAVNIRIEDFEDVNGIVIEDSNYSLFSIKSKQGPAVQCRKEIQIKRKVRSVILSRDAVILNNSGSALTLEHEGCQFLLSDKKVIPVTWDLEKIYISANSEGLCKVPNKDVDVILQRVVSPASEITFGNTIFLHSLYIFTNLLPCSIVLKVGNTKSFNVASGEKLFINFEISSSEALVLELFISNYNLISHEFYLSEYLKRVTISGNFKWKISAQIKSTSSNSKEIIFYSQYLVVNATDFLFEFNNQKFPSNSIGFLRSSKEVAHVRLCGEFNCKSTEKVNLKAVGVSSCLVIPLINPVFNSFCVGIRIMHAPSPLSYSKIIKLLPRFVIVNYLDFKIYIKQHSKSSTRIVEIETGKSINYQFDDFSQGSNIQVSEDKYQWSGPFCIANIEDFQIRFKAAPREVPKSKNIFAKDDFWYLSCPRNQMFYYLRVNIATENDTSINVLLSNPRDPNFKIHNATDVPITVKQSKCKEPVINIPAGCCLPWAFDNFIIPNKKVTVKIKDFKQKYSLEKIKEGNKNIGDHSASVQFEGDCRVLTIYDVEETEVDLKINIIEKVTEKYIRKLNLTLTSINFSMLDEQNTEHFLVSMKEILIKNSRTDERRNRQMKTRNKLQVIIGKFQVDNMIIKPNLFQVVGYQSKIVENTPFFHLRYDREYSSGPIESSYITPLDRILEFELQMQELHLKINYEFIVSFSSLYQIYMKSFYQIKEKERKKGTVEEMYPELNSSVVVPPLQQQSVKTYFKFVRVHGMNLILTFQNSEKPILVENASEMTASVSNFFLDLAHIEGSPLKFTEIILQYSFQNLYSLSWALIKNYVRQGLLQFYRVLGSSELLGNPIGLIDKLGTGVYEFFNEPAKGLLLGPKGFINGVGKGVRSLVGNLIAGSFESVSKITGSLYKIVSYENFNSSNIYNNLGIMDLASGVSGIVTRPYKGYKTSGAKGLVKGMGAGIVGVFVAPVAAVLHFSTTVTSKVAETANMIKISTNFIERIRFPRNVSVSRALEPYDSEQAKIRYYILAKNLDPIEVVNVIGLEKECVVVMRDRIIVMVGDTIVEDYKLNNFTRKEVHFYKKNFLLILTGEENLYVSSINCAPILKIFLAVNLTQN